MRQGISPEMAALLLAQEQGLLLDDLGRAVEQSFRYGRARDFEREILSKRVMNHKIEMARCPVHQAKSTKPRKLRDRF